jgi:ATP-dependent DNA helicase DinG
MGKKCPNREDCFYQKAKKKEYQSHVLVTNHHLFFANLSSGEKILPEYDAIVFDEAHTLEEVATDYLGLEVSNFRLRFLFDSVSSARTGKGLLGSIENLKEDKRKKIEKMVADIRIAADRFFSGIVEKCPSETGGERSRAVRICQPNFVPNILSEPLLALSSEIKTLLPVSKNEEEILEISALSMRAKAISDEIETILSQGLQDYVYWAEIINNPRYPRYILHASPINIGELMKEAVFSRVSPIVFTSATLSANGSFDYLRERVGLDKTKELILGSPFNFKENVLLYLPSGLPDPGNETEDYIKEVTKQVSGILEITGGQTFVLFTSFKMLNDIYESLKDFSELNILRQGELPRYKMLEKFRQGGRESRNSQNGQDSQNGKSKGMVLFGTNTFWQGVDVPGKALECVIITKLPFSVPDDPVTKAKMEYLQKEGKDPFLSYQVPQAIIMLKQGFGRLIRTKEDRGLVAILDPRLKTRSYGETFLRSLPECKITTEIEDVDEFFSKIREEGATT